MNKKEVVNKLKLKMFLLFPLGIALIGLILFLPAGTINYWQAWLFLATLFIPFFFVATYFMKHDPELLQRRMQFKEKENEQKLIIKLSNIIFFIGIIIPGLDHRYAWSSVPAWQVILSDIIIFLGYMLIFRVFKENSYTARTVEVMKGQKVITTGPYSIIRHPMYAGIIPMYMFIPIALGSYAALIPFTLIIPLIIARTLNEEKILLKQLKGYKEYTKKVKYRLMPGIW